ncbi:hypothetical protein ACFVGY_14240 [Streptomyces sp. NPDC127106]|uniref:hypothetical protein n=1 Tax=Streptomyces sp. NPDC127106 TaxID=3345360 RepID=UPI00363BAE53
MSARTGAGARYLERFRARHAEEYPAGATRRILPAAGTQRRFAAMAAVSGRRLAVPLFMAVPAGLVDARHLDAALRVLADRHPALRCRVVVDRGLPVQEWAADRTPRLAVAHVGSADAAGRAAAAAIRAVEDGRTATALHTVLLRGPEQDLLGFVFDHAVVDETSLRLFTADLFRVLDGGRPDGSADPAGLPAGEPAGGDPWTAFRDAVWTHVAAEAAAGDRVGHWVGRLTPVARRWAARRASAPEQHASAPGGASAPDQVPGVVRPLEPAPLPAPVGRARAALFPLALASLHLALRDTGVGAPTTVGYAWGARTDAAAHTVGCFMNTVLSASASTAPAGSPHDAARFAERFVDAWWQDVDHADVPFDEVVGAVGRATRIGWPGEADALLVLEDVRDRTPLRLAGRPVAEWLPPLLSPKAGLSGALRLDADELRLRVLVAPGTPAARCADGIAAAWRTRLEALLVAHAGSRTPAS